MPRAAIDDMILTFRYQVYLISAAPDFFLTAPTKFDGGFRNVTLPTLVTIDETEYREGDWGLSQWYYGVGHSEQVTLSMGMTYTRSNLYQWIYSYLSGKAFRTHLLVASFSQHAFIAKSSYERNAPIAVIANGTEPHFSSLEFKNAQGQKVPVYGKAWLFYQSFPLSIKAPDLDATGTDVIVEELSLRYEYVDVYNIVDGVGSIIDT